MAGTWKARLAQRFQSPNTLLHVPLTLLSRERSEEHVHACAPLSGCRSKTATFGRSMLNGGSAIGLMKCQTTFVAIRAGIACATIPCHKSYPGPHEMPLFIGWRVGEMSEIYHFRRRSSPLDELRYPTTCAVNGVTNVTIRPV